MYPGPPWPIRSPNVSVGVGVHIGTLTFHRFRMPVKMSKELQTLLRI